MSDTVTLIAGILLTSVGLLALLPYALKHGWRHASSGLPVDTGHSSITVPVGVFAAQPDDRQPHAGDQSEDIKELLGHLFSLRLTVSEIAAGIEETREVLDGDAPDGGEESPGEAPWKRVA